MKRTVNSTGRLRITRQLVSFDISRGKHGEPISFRADLTKLKDLGLPENAAVTVEAYYRTSGVRFACGTIAGIAVLEGASLAEVDRGGEILFRVKVVDQSDVVGRLLASGDRLPANSPFDDGQEQSRKPLLPAKPEWLGERTWDVSEANAERPFLLVNIRIPDLAHRISADPVLGGSVLPEAFRRILGMLLDSENADLEWIPHWKAFLGTLGCPTPDDLSDDPQERRDYVDHAVKAFTDKFQFVSRTLLVGEPGAQHGD